MLDFACVLIALPIHVDQRRHDCRYQAGKEPDNNNNTQQNRYNFPEPNQNSSTIAATPGACRRSRCYGLRCAIPVDRSQWNRRQRSIAVADPRLLRRSAPSAAANSLTRPYTKKLRQLQHCPKNRFQQKSQKYCQHRWNQHTFEPVQEVHRHTCCNDYQAPACHHRYVQMQHACNHTPQLLVNRTGHRGHLRIPGSSPRRASGWQGLLGRADDYIALHQTGVWGSPPWSASLRSRTS
mmetsp:Transcript_27748/g.71848  ORF Transcript_27748/g.71848 Transcript_27748/m.71848 type:complete len:237 (-) Transcript_27748:72-782(-)